MFLFTGGNVSKYNRIDYILDKLVRQKRVKMMPSGFESQVNKQNKSKWLTALSYLGFGSQFSHLYYEAINS